MMNSNSESYCDSISVLHVAYNVSSRWLDDAFQNTQRFILACDLERWTVQGSHLQSIMQARLG